MENKKIGSVLKTETKVIAYVVICLVVIVLGISYALFFEVKGNEKNQIVKAGTLEFTYANGSQITNETNSDCFILMSEEEALKHNECEYKISITNTGTLPGNYNINLTSETVDKPMALNKLKVILKKEGQVVADYPKDGTTTSLVSNEKIEAGNVINYSVQVYVDADNELLNAEDDEKNISLKINGDAVVNGEEVNPTMPATDYIKNIPTIENGDGLYKVSHDVSEISTDWNKTEYRYAGANPNNYVRFNNEIWRIIGVVNVKTKNGIEQRIKIVRTDEIKEQQDFGNFSWNIINDDNNWITSTLKDMLNGIYYNSSSGVCYKGTINSENCDFTQESSVRGISDVAREMIDSSVVWNLGRWDTSTIDSNNFYEKERFEQALNNINYPVIWSKDNDSNFNGIGLIYPSDYGYAALDINNNSCFNKKISYFNIDNCNSNNWLKMHNKSSWLITSFISYGNGTFYILDYGVGTKGGYLITDFNIWPSLYLKPSVKIVANPNSNQEYGSIDNPFILE